MVNDLRQKIIRRNLNDRAWSMALSVSIVKWLKKYSLKKTRGKLGMGGGEMLKKSVCVRGCGWLKIEYLGTKKSYKSVQKKICSYPTRIFNKKLEMSISVFANTWE